MAVLRVWDYWEMEVDGAMPKGGSRSSPLELTVDGKYIDKDFSLATATALTLWQSDDALTNFDYFWLKADQDLRIELTCDRGNDVGKMLFGFIWTANTPFRLIYDDALALYTAAFATGTADVIDKIAIKNVSGSTANGRFALVT